MYNKVLLIGRVVNNPTLKYSQQGKAVATFSIAVERMNDETDFFDLVSFDKQAEIASKYLTKGRLIMVEGRIQTRSFEGQDGTKRKIYEIIIDNFRMLDKKPDNERKTEKPIDRFVEDKKKPEKSFDKPYKNFDEFEVDQDFDRQSKTKYKPKRVEEEDFDDFFFDDN